jgi:hypothetical protein
VSSDGTNWLEAIRIDSATGKVAFPVSGGPREVLAADRTYYVRTDGSDDNNGLANTSGGAFLTIQRAYEIIAANLDLAGKTVTIQVGDGTYPAGLSVSGPWTGGGAVIVQGNAGTPANVLIGTSGDCVSVSCNLPGALTVKDLKLTSSGGKGISHTGGGTLNYSGINFGSAGAYHIYSGTSTSIVQATGKYSISGGASAHYVALNGGTIITTGVTATLTGTPAFGTGLAFAFASRLGFITAESMTFTGSATGKRYNADTNAVIATSGGGANYFPGNSSGSASLGGQYT